MFFIGFNSVHLQVITVKFSYIIVYDITHAIKGANQRKRGVRLLIGKQLFKQKNTQCNRSTHRKLLIYMVQAKTLISPVI